MTEKKRYSIGVMIGGVHTYFPKELIRGIISAAQELDVNVYFFLGTQTKGFFRDIIGEYKKNTYDYQFNTIYDYSLFCGLDGLIINYGTLGIYMEDTDAQAFAHKFNSIPTIFMTEVVYAPNCYSIISDNYQGICTVMEHLICDHHYKKILFMGGPENNTDACERKRAYFDMMKKYALPVTPGMVAAGNYSEFVDRQVEDLLDGNPDAEAIVFANDEMAYSGYKVCRKRGIHVGRDIAFTGYDDCDIAAGLIPPLTTVSQDGVLMGRTALYDIINICSGGPCPPAVKRIPAALVRRESCGCRQETPVSEAEPVDLSEKIEKLNRELAEMQQDFINFQRKSWLIPILARDLNECIDDEREFGLQIMERFKEFGTGSAYLLLLDNPVVYNGKDRWNCPDKLRLAAYYKDGQAFSYHTYDRPVISKDQPFAQAANDSKNHQHMVFLLFSGEKQYGLLLCDLNLEDFSYFYVVGLQLGLSLRYLEISQIESAHRRQMYLDMEQMREKNLVLDMISGYDELTGLLNLRGFTKQAKKRCKEFADKKAYVIYSDLDHLKEINDTWGHNEGNFAICSAADILKHSLRDSDILARIGGDEFVCLVVSDSDSFEKIFRRRVRFCSQELNDTSGKPFYVELSVGLTSFTLKPDMDIQQVLALSDKQLYEAKKYRRASVKKP